MGKKANVSAQCRHQEKFTRIEALHIYELNDFKKILSDQAYQTPHDNKQTRSQLLIRLMTDCFAQFLLASNRAQTRLVFQSKVSNP